MPPEGKGVAGMVRAFREVMEELGPGKRVLFLGSEGTCLPFAELLAYACRELGNSFYFCPGVRIERTVELRWRRGYGFQTGRRVRPGRVDAVVVMGGLALPGSGVGVEEVKGLLPLLLGEGGKVLGFSFMGILERKGWERELRFDRLLDVGLDKVRVR
jgi:hypothetical protein